MEDYITQTEQSLSIDKTQTLSPLEQARIAHEADNSPRSFIEDWSLHLLNPYSIVINNENEFLLARPVCTNWTIDRLVSPWTFALQPDCYWVYLFAGRCVDTLRSHRLPDVPYIGYERRGKARFLQTQSLRRLR